MSTRATATESQKHRLGIPPEKAFDELVFNERTVCSRCFSQIRRYDTYRPDAAGGVSKYAPEERCIRAFDGEKGYKTEPAESPPEWVEDGPIPAEDYVYGYRPLPEPRTYCGECGSKSGRADDLILARRTALGFAENLIDRLEDAGVAVDRHAMKFMVRELKSREQLCGYDTEIFRRATKVAIRHARR